jgi:hypothetical protein
MPSEDPQDLTPVQQLLRMRRNQTPSDEFVEIFLADFKERQRSEMLKQSARGLLWERWTTYWENRAAPKWALAGVAAALALGFGWVLMPKAVEGPGGVEVVASESGLSSDIQADPNAAFGTEAILIMGMDPEGTVEEAPMLLSRHFSGGYADEAREVKAAVRQESGQGEMSGKEDEP